MLSVWEVMNPSIHAVCSLKPGYGNSAYGSSPMMDIKPSINPHMAAVSTAAPISSSGGGEAWEGRSIAGPKLRLCDFSAFLEQQRDAETVSSNIQYDRYVQVSYVLVGGISFAMCQQILLTDEHDTCYNI